MYPGTGEHRASPPPPPRSALAHLPAHKSQSFSSRKGKSQDAGNNAADGNDTTTPRRERDHRARRPSGDEKGRTRSPRRSPKRSPKRPTATGGSGGENVLADDNGATNDPFSNTINGNNTSTSTSTRSDNKPNNNHNYNHNHNYNDNNNVSNNGGGSRRRRAPGERVSAAEANADATDATAAAAASEASQERAGKDAAAAAAARSLSRPANFGIGAVDVAPVGGGVDGRGVDGHVGLELAPIEEDQLYRREMETVRAAGGKVRQSKVWSRP